MADIPDTALGRMYREHIDQILAKDMEALLDQYTDDCLLISSFTREPQYYRGRDGLREHMLGIMGIQDLETEIAFWAETENPSTLMMVEKIIMRTDEGESVMRFADSWVLRDGRIAIHFAGMTQYPDGSVA
jgi:ketosteroid isomerase-like protein